MLGEKTAQVDGEVRNVKVPLIPSYIGGLEGCIVRLSIFSDSLGDDLDARQQLTMLQAQQIVASGSCGSSVPFDEWVNPVEAP